MTKLVAIWTRQWIRDSDLKKTSDRIYMTDERLASMVNEAYTAGVADGDNQGRIALRELIESGEVTIERRQA